MYHLAQVNIARLIYPIDSPELHGFTSRLDAVNALAEAAPGFIWRLVGDGNDATGLRPFPDPDMIINMSVWQDVQSLFDFTYRNADHAGVMRGRRAWFHKPEGPHLVLWWVPAGTLPSLSDARDRLAYLAQHGPTPEAFTLKQTFPSPP